MFSLGSVFDFNWYVCSFLEVLFEAVYGWMADSICWFSGIETVVKIEFCKYRDACMRMHWYSNWVFKSKKVASQNCRGQYIHILISGEYMKHYCTVVFNCYVCAVVICQESEMSMTCLANNDYDHDRCSLYFENYRNCLKFWVAFAFLWCLVKAEMISSFITSLDIGTLFTENLHFILRSAMMLLVGWQQGRPVCNCRVLLQPSPKDFFMRLLEPPPLGPSNTREPGKCLAKRLCTYCEYVCICCDPEYVTVYHLGSFNELVAPHRRKSHWGHGGHVPRKNWTAGTVLHYIPPLQFGF